MKLHDLAPAPGSRRPARRVGRGNGGKSGTYAGRGRKGQGARSGGGKGPYFEGGQLPLVRRLPYKRGFVNPFRVSYTAVNLETLDALFDAGALVTPESLAACGILNKKDEPYKVLAGGELSKSLAVHAMGFSAAARTAIENVGGSCNVLAYERPHVRREHKRYS